MSSGDATRIEGSAAGLRTKDTGWEAQANVVDAQPHTPQDACKNRLWHVSASELAPTPYGIGLDEARRRNA